MFFAKVVFFGKTQETFFVKKFFAFKKIIYFCRMDEKQILKEVRTLFVKYGIKSVSMDDIAGHLGISKKLFIIFSDKRELVYSVIKVTWRR